MIELTNDEVCGRFARIVAQSLVDDEGKEKLAIARQKMFVRMGGDTPDNIGALDRFENAIKASKTSAGLVGSSYTLRPARLEVCARLSAERARSQQEAKKET